MITTSSAFKTAAKAVSKTVKSKLTDGTHLITGDDDLISFKLTGTGSICKSVMRKLEAKYLGAHTYLGTRVTPSYGVKIAGGSISYIDYGAFEIITQETDQGTDEVTITGYDSMYEANQPYDLVPTYPMTLGDFLTAICTRLGWTQNGTTFNNSTLTLTGELFSESHLTFRQILDQIAQTAGSIIYFNTSNQLVVKQIEKSTMVETLDKDILSSLKLQTKYGPINSVVLSRQPQEDDIVQVNQTSIDADGLTEVKIVNDLIVDADRTTYLPVIFSALSALYFYPFEAKTISGLGYFEIGDRIVVQDPGGNSYQVIIFDLTVEVGPGISETLKAVKPDLTSTPYQYAGFMGQQIKNTQIIVDKQAGEIDIINETVDGAVSSIAVTNAAITSVVSQVNSNVDTIETIQEDLASLTQTADAIQVSIQGIGGVNLLTNSTGLKGTITEWLQSSPPANNNGTIVQTSDVATNTESHSGIQITNQYITQTFPTISGQTYTFYCRFKKTGTATVTITGVGTINLTGVADGNWGVFKLQFTAAGSSTTLTLATGAGVTCIISDAVVKLGDVSGWIQAPNEVYGTNFRFDKDGFSITSTLNKFKSQLDSAKLAVFDTSSGSDREVMNVSNSSAKLTGLISQGETIIQRVGISAGAMRIIPTNTGAQIVINTI